MTFDNWILEHGTDFQVPLFFGALTLFLLLERLAPKRPGPMDRRRRWPTNWGLTVVNIVALSFIPLSFIGAALWAEQKGVGLFHVVSLPLPILVVSTLLVRGFISFFTHFLNHKVPFLWRFHRVHHLDTELDVSSTVRFHPVEFVLSTFIGLPIVVLFGLSPWVLIFYELLDVAVTLFSHCNLRLPTSINRPLRYVIVTPDLHRVHHSTWQPETDSNFGAVFPIWDLIFGTFRKTPREGHESMRIGLDDLREPEANRFTTLLLSPFTVAAAGSASASGPSSVRDSPVDHAGVAFHPPVLLAIAIGLGFVGRSFIPLSFFEAPYRSTVGVLLFALSWALFFWSAIVMKRGQASIPCKEPTRAIVRQGPYRFSRNPIYLSMVALQIGLGIWLDSLWFVGFGLLMAPLLWWGVISREESYLARRFGEEYESYRARVRRWI